MTWNEDTATWLIDVKDANGNAATRTANAVICAVGFLSRPKSPTIKGMETFAGPSFHTAWWDRGFDDRAGKHLAVIGTGCRHANPWHADVFEPCRHLEAGSRRRGRGCDCGRMLDTSQLVAFVPVTDPARAKAFYVGVLGLTVREDTPFALVCDVGGTTLRITPVGDLTPQSFTVLGWEVDDIGAIGRRLADAGVDLMQVEGIDQDALGIWTTSGGDRVAWFHDPDGNVLSISQHATTG